VWVIWMAMKLSSIPAGLFVFAIAVATFFALSAIATLVFFFMGQAVPERQPGDPMRRASSCVGNCKHQPLARSNNHRSINLVAAGTSGFFTLIQNDDRPDRCGFEPCALEHRHERFVQARVGLHHLCLRARSREDVDACAATLKDMGATIVRGPLEGTWAPGYYYVLFEDPDGIRLEIYYVPGAGVFAEGAAFNPGEGYR